LLHRDVVDPGSESRVEELLPLTPNMEHQGMTEKKMLQSKASCHSPEVEEISGEENP